MLSADLVGSLDIANLPNPLVPGDSVTVALMVTNQGDQSAVGRMDIQFYLSTEPSMADAWGPVVLANQAVSLAPGRAKAFRAKVTVPSSIPAGNYYLLAQIDPSHAISADNPANNFVVSSQPRALTYQFGWVPGRAKSTKLTLEDADGSKATFSLRGNGRAELIPGAELFALSLTGADAASAVTISVKGGDKRYSLGTVTLGSLKSFAAPAVDLAGDFLATGTIGSLTMGDVASGHSLSIQGLNMPLTLTARSVTNLSLQSASPVKSIKVANWTRSGQAASTIIAPLVSSLQAGGDLQVDLHLSQQGLALGKVSAVGELGPGIWDVAGNVGRITAGQTDAGWRASFAGPLTSLTVRGNASGNLSARSIGSISIKGNLSGGQILSGADLGSDAALGGAGGAADTYGIGWIGTLSVTGAVSDSLILAGVHPFDGAFNDLNDVIIGGSASFIKTISIGGTLDAASAINAGRLPTTASIARVRIRTASDPRFAQGQHALTDAGMTDANGEITLDIAGQRQTFKFLDEATLAPLADAGVAVAVDASTRSFGVMTIVSPTRSVPVQMVVLEGSAPSQQAVRGPTTRLAASSAARSMAIQAQQEVASDETVPVLVSDVATKATQDIITDKLVAQMFYNVAEADRSVIGSTVGALASGFTSLVSIGVHALDNVAHGAVSDYLASLPMASSQVLTPEQAKAHVIQARKDDLTSTLVLAGMKRKLDPTAPYAVALDLGSDYVSWGVANMAADLPGMGVRVTNILGMEIYSFVPIPPWQRAEEAGLVNVHVPTAAEAENGFLELISKGDIGDGQIVPLDTAGNAQVAVPIGDYIGVIHAPGFLAKQVPVAVTAGGVQLDVDLELPPEPGFTISPASELRTSEDRTADSFTVALTTRPSANVTIKLSSSDTTEGKLSRSSLVFTPANWNVPQLMVVTGINDSLVDGDQAYTIITSPAISADPAYSGLNPDDLTATNRDNEESPFPTVTITSASPRLISSGGWATFKITVTGVVTGPVGTYFYFNGEPPEGFTMDSWTGHDDRGRPCRNPGDPSSTSFSYVDEVSYVSVSLPDTITIVCNVKPPDSVGETVQATRQVLLSL